MVHMVYTYGLKGPEVAWAIGTPEQLALRECQSQLLGLAVEARLE